jgi:hypothetical protein
MSLLREQIYECWSKAVADAFFTIHEGLREIREAADADCERCQGSGLAETDGYIETGDSRWCRARKWKAKVTDVCSCVDRTRLSRGVLRFMVHFFPHRRAI